MAGPLQTTMFNGVTPFYPGVATSSQRFDIASSSYLTYTPSSATSATDRRKMTWSGWIKRNALGVQQALYSARKDTSGSDYFLIAFAAGDTLRVIFDVEDANEGYESDAIYRDVGQWYHFCIIIDTTQSTDTNRLKVYVNGNLQEMDTLYSGGHVTQNFSVYAMDGGADYISYFYAATALASFQLSNVDITFGQDNLISEFGETKNGIWIAKNYGGSYGGNGVKFKFDQVGVGTASSSTCGADSSGNGNHWTSSGIEANDCNQPDSPENNFATMNSLINGYGTNLTMAEGNLKASSSADEYNNTFGTILMQSGKWYWEITSDNFNNYAMYGVAAESAVQTTDSTSYGQSGVYVYATHGAVYNESTSGSSADTYTNFLDQEIIGIAVDLDASPRTFKFYNDNTLQGTTNLSTNFNVDLLPIFVLGGTQKAFVNFGQDSSFAGQKTAQGNTDGNGQGDFFYTPPSGHLALCSANLADNDIGPNSDTQADEYFGVTTWSGDNADSRNITDYQFQPDWAWIKCRNTSGNGFDHVLFDSQRGVSSSINTALSSSQNDQEGLGENVTTSAQLGGISAFLSNGFTLLEGSSSDDARYVNENSRTYVGWAWKAGGATGVSNTDGTITSTVSANTTAGFSIVLYAGSESNATVGHGLGGVPDLLIWKKRNGVNDWIVYHSGNTSAPATDHLHLNNTNATSDPSGSTFFQDTLPTSTVFSIGTDDDVNDAKNYVVYCFRSIEGYSSFGEYTGNGSTDGAFVYCGFRPAFIITKKTSGTGNWYINDTTRATYNPTSTSAGNLYADLDNAEGGNGMDILSNGFKIRNTDSSQNTSGGTYVFLAFAENPQKYANAR